MGREDGDSLNFGRCGQTCWVVHPYGFGKMGGSVIAEVPLSAASPAMHVTPLAKKRAQSGGIVAGADYR